ncbi:MAG: hypothetical protein K0S47_3892 [Herbinix sp.]|jgi:signal transduction histidine kinase|nr:hypothetical protein [Herbinix sp.]
MLTETDNDRLSLLVKSNPEFDTLIKKLVDDNKQTTSMFVHELRNPLTLMKGTLQYIEQKHPETKEFKYWNQLQELVYDMEHMMADASMLNVCNSLLKEKHDLIELVKTIKSNFMPQAANQQVELILDIAEGCEEYFNSYLCDSTRMKQVLSNLVKNALEATTAGNFIKISLSYKPEIDQVPPKLSIQISNNGLPIPEDIIATIFVPFVTYKKGGTGIGLAVVKRIIDLHYGSVSVTSNDDLTSFLILLPV